MTPFFTQATFVLLTSLGSPLTPQVMLLLTQLSNAFVLMALTVPGIVKLLASRSEKSPEYRCQARINCLLLLRHIMPWALVLALLRAGKSMAARIAMMAITT